MTTVDPVGRILARCSRSETCWLWSGTITTDGYGEISSLANRTRKTLAHRASYEAFVGPVPTGMYILHSCDTPACVNPAHLRVGTQFDNMRDAVERGRSKTCGGATMFAGKTHCVNGHSFSGNNLRQRADGGRACRACKRESAKRRYYKKHDALAAALKGEA